MTLSSTTHRPKSNLRLTYKTLHLLSFIHRFRSVTAYHLQISLRHASVTSTLSLLRRLSAAGLIETHEPRSRTAGNIRRSYTLTPEGLKVLKDCDVKLTFRTTRSIMSDKTMSEARRMRYHSLADLYVHFKRHYDGQFEFFTASDIAGLSGLPDELPDGYVRLNMPDVGLQHYLIEIYGWNRSSTEQRRRLSSVVRFVEAHDPRSPVQPRFFIVTSSPRTQDRVHRELVDGFKNSLVSPQDVYISTTTAHKLSSATAAIWRSL